MTALTDLVDFIAPNFATDTTRRDTAITMATRYLGATSAKWGAVYNDAIANLAAHLLTIYDPNGPFAAGAGSVGAGPVTSIRTGDWAVSYAGPATMGSGATGDAVLMMTPYGQEYVRLRNSRAAGKARVVYPNNTD